MDTVATEKPDKKPGKRRPSKVAPPFSSTNQPAYNPGRPKGSVSLSAAYRRALAELDPTDLEGRRTVADGIAQKFATAALHGELDAAKEIRIATEGDTLHADVTSTNALVIEERIGGDDADHG